MVGKGVVLSPGVKSKDLYPSIFSRHAAEYQKRLDEIMARGEARGRRRAIEVLELRPGMRVLDLACGPGTLSKVIAGLVDPDGEVVGVDLAPGMVELARSGGMVNARFEVMDIEQLGFADASFDAAICGHGLQFAPDLVRALREARRVLKADARFAASVPVSAGTQRPWQVMDAVVDRWLPPAPKASDQDATRSAVNDPDSLRAAALTAGFGAAHVEVIEERVRWESADQLVARCMSWWDLAARMEGATDSRRQAFREDALATLRKEFPGAIDTTGITHVLWAGA
jgi:ubiquinone/menaquinone biosynthesis C-methylase UbiE